MKILELITETEEPTNPDDLDNEDGEWDDDEWDDDENDMPAELRELVNDWHIYSGDINVEGPKIMAFPEVQAYTSPPSVQWVYRALIIDPSSKSSPKRFAVPYSLSVDGCVEFVRSLDVDIAAIFRKKFFPGDFMLNFDALYGMCAEEEDYAYGEEDYEEEEIWMRPTLYYRKLRKNEIVCFTDGRRLYGSIKDYEAGKHLKKKHIKKLRNN